jgi:O-antigen/teichoic acid export membrane protein
MHTMVREPTGEVILHHPGVRARLSRRALMRVPLSRDSAQLRKAAPAFAFVGLRGVQYSALFISGLVASRVLGPEGRATYALPLAMGSFVWLVLHFSLDAAVARLYARQEVPLAELVRTRMAAVWAVGIVGALVVVGIGMVSPRRLMGNADLTGVILAAATVPLWLSVSSIGSLLLVVGKAMRYAVAGAVSGVLQLLVLVILVVGIGVTPDLAILTVVVGLTANLALVCRGLTGTVGAKALIPAWNRTLFLRLLRVGAMLHPAAVAVGLSLQIDLFCIAAIGSRAQVGYYSVAATLASSLFLAINALAQTAVHRQMDHDQEAAAAYTVRFVRKATCLALGLAAAGALLGYPLIRLVYGPAWSGSYLPFAILTVATIPLMLQGPLAVFLSRSVRPAIFAFAGVAVVTLNLGFNVVLIPLLGLSGCALSSFCAYVLYTAGLLHVFRRTTGLRVIPHRITEVPV